MQFTFFEDAPIKVEESIVENLASFVEYSLKQLLQTLPSTLAYVFDCGMPRRDLWDAKRQVMQDDSKTEEEKSFALGDEDIKINSYEGGLKTWECAKDLVALVNHESAESVLELGCGTALPTLAMFQKRLQSGNGGRFVLADFNESVLELVTAANLLLVWIYHNCPAKLTEKSGEIDIAEYIPLMLDDLETRSLQVSFLAGPWSAIMHSTTTQDMFSLILASETIYSLDSLKDFTLAVNHFMKPNGKALVAAKQIYFGVGGGVEEFIQVARPLMKVNRIFQTTCFGVARCVLECTHS